MVLLRICWIPKKIWKFSAAMDVVKVTGGMIGQAHQHLEFSLKQLNYFGCVYGVELR
jgi:hypothetical protein